MSVPNNSFYVANPTRSRNGDVLTPFGLLGDRLVAAADVVSGLACGCTCPGCGARLVAKKGRLRAWSFAHYGSAGSLACAESAIHAAAKQVLAETMAVIVPEMRVRVAATTTGGVWHSREHLLDVQRRVRFDSCDIEVTLGAVRPDFVGYRGERKMVVEIFVTHRVDEDKVAVLKLLGFPALEIDFSDFARQTTNVDFDILRQRIVDGARYTRWLHYPGAEQSRQELAAELDTEMTSLDRQAREAAHTAVAIRVRSEVDYRALSLDEKERRLRRALAVEGQWPSYIDESRFHAPALGHPTHLWQGLIYAQFVIPRPRRTVFAVDEVVEWITARLGWDTGENDPTPAIRGYLAFLCARYHLVREVRSSTDGRVKYSCLQTVRRGQATMPSTG